MTNVSKQVGLRIQEIRKSKGLSQEDLSELIGLTKNYIGLLERGQRNPSLKTLTHIAQALGTSMKSLFDFE